MANKLTTYVGAVEDGYFPHLRERGFPFALGVSHVNGQVALRTNLVRLLKEIPNNNQRWAYSFIGPLEQRHNLSVLSLLAEQWPDVGIHLSEMLKTEAQAMTFCEIAFLAPHSLIEEMLLRSNLSFGWDLTLCGWLLNTMEQADLFLDFKRDDKVRFTIPSPAIELAFASSEDWDRIEFFSAREEILTKIEEGLLKRYQHLPH